MNRSLRLRLLGSLSATVLAAWVATAVFSYLDARREIGRMLDDHLVQASSLLTRHAADPSEVVVDPPLHWGEGHAAHALVYQGWSDDGKLLFRSSDAPLDPLSHQAEGFSEVDRDGAKWRVFGRRVPDGQMLILVAEHAGFRGELAAGVAQHLLHPLAFALPILAALIWFAVGWGLRPLRAIASEVGRREPANVEPLVPDGAPAEVRPLVVSLNALLARVSSLVENERRFTADAAHELRTPLAAIGAHAEVALAANDEEERRQALIHVGEGVHRINHLVGQLLAVARLDARATLVPSSRVMLAEIAAQQVADAAPFASAKGVNLGLDGCDESTVVGDESLLGILIRNLVDNAVRYTPRGGQVDVSVREDNGRVLLKVEDSGPGVPESERARLVERFHRGRTSGEDGSGLGLSIVSRIAQLHGATLFFGSGLGGRGLGVTVAWTKERALRLP